MSIRPGSFAPQVTAPHTLYPGYVAGTDEAQLVQQNRLIGAAAANFQKAHRVLTDGATSVRLVYGNFWGSDALYDHDITVTAGVYLLHDAAGGHRDVTFAGRGSVTIPRGGMAVSDPIAAEFVKGDNLVTTTFVTSAGTDCPANYFIGAGTGNRRDVATTDVRATSTWADTTSHWGYGPMHVLIRPLTPPSRLLAVMGDSLVYGFGDFPTHVGFVTRAARRDGVPYVKVAMPSENSATFALPHHAHLRRTFVEGSTHALVNYGANDSGFRTVAQFQADITKIWTDLGRRGVKVIAMTVGPKTDGTWETVEGQTVRSPTGGSWSDADLATVNDWIRTKPSTSIRAVWDYADVVMSARNSARWRNDAGTALTGDGTHPNEVGHTYIAARLDLTALLAA